MSILKNKCIAIVGAGPAGLTLARLLQLSNFTCVNVYERDVHKDARSKGATLDLHHDSGLRALEAAGLMDAFKSHYRPGADHLRITDKHANIVFEDSQDEKQITRFRPEIDRGPLQDLLLESLEPNTVIWNSQLSTLTKTGERWALVFKDGSSIEADMVIGADGANSKVRSYLTSIKPFFSGVTIVEGSVHNSQKITPNIHNLLNGGKVFALENSKSLIISSKGDGSLVFYTGCKTDELWSKTCGLDFSDTKQIANWFKNEFAGWDSIWMELFDHADPGFIARPQYCMPTDQSWDALPDVTMIGDAAHLMPPFAGEGVNMAMLDALELVLCLNNNEFPDVHSAIKAFEAQMRLRAGEAADISMQSTKAMHASGAIDYLLQIVS